METFVDYYNAAKKDYKYTIKLAKNDLTEDEVGRLEKQLQRYNLKSMSAMKKTPIQQEPLDFPNVRDCEVNITDVVLEYPITPDALLREVADGVHMDEGAVAIYAENDPRHQYIDEWNERMVDNEEYFSKYKPRLGNPENWEPEPDYGDTYNTSFLKSLDTVKKDRQRRFTTETNDLIPDQVTDKETVTGDEKAPVYNDSVLNDRYRDAENYSPEKGKNTLMSKPAKGN